MKLEIDKTPIVVADLDVVKFKAQMKRDFDLEKAVINNLKIKVNKIKYDIDRLKKYIYMGVDWGNVFMLFKQIKANTTEIHVYKCYFTGLTTYNPGTIDMEKNVYEFDEKMNDKSEFLIATVFNPRIEKHIEYLISQHLIDYVNFNWKMVYKLD